MDHETARAVPKPEEHQRVTSIPFSALPHQSRLFLEYLADPLSLRRYYPNAVPTPLDVAPFAADVLSGYTTDRSQLADALTHINTKIGAGEPSLRNVDRLRSGDCVAVVTGQQAGLFTGPIYTIYKALSAIRLAERITEQGINAVPVFWVASEDHDLDEVAHTDLILDGNITSVSYRHVGPVGGPVGELTIGSSIASTLDDVAAVSASAAEQLRSAYAAGQGFATAFACTLMRCLGKLGIVVIDPIDPAIKQLSAPIYTAAINKAPEIVESIRARTTDLGLAGYHAQVLVEEDYFPFFWHDESGKRIAIRRSTNERYSAKGTKQKFDLRELSELASATPERFSPGVMLRPVVQDYLLPTICYFGGAAEVAYFAQNAPAYEVLDRPATPIFHRQSFTVVEPKQRRDLTRLRLELTDLFIGSEGLRLKLSQDGFWSDTGQLFAETKETIAGQLDRLDKRLNEIDVTLAESLSKRRRKILHHVDALEKKSLLAHSRKNEVLNRRIDGLVNSLAPRGQLQERTVNVFSYISKYGPSFIDQIYDAVDLGDKAHRVVDIT